MVTLLRNRFFLVKVFFALLFLVSLAQEYYYHAQTLQLYLSLPLSGPNAKLGEKFKLALGDLQDLYPNVHIIIENNRSSDDLSKAQLAQALKQKIFVGVLSTTSSVSDPNFHFLQSARSIAAKDLELLNMWLRELTQTLRQEI